jgi:hypothetical protein
MTAEEEDISVRVEQWVKGYKLPDSRTSASSFISTFEGELSDPKKKAILAIMLARCGMSIESANNFLSAEQAADAAVNTAKLEGILENFYVLLTHKIIKMYKIGQHL